MKFKVGDKVKTRDGRPARIISTEGSRKRPLVAMVEHMSGDDEWCQTYHADGAIGPGYDRAGDLIPPKRKRVVYVNICDQFFQGAQSCEPGVRYFDSRREADEEWVRKHGGKFGAQRYACIRVEVDEGRFDE